MGYRSWGVKRREGRWEAGSAPSWFLSQHRLFDFGREFEKHHMPVIASARMNAHFEGRTVVAGSFAESVGLRCLSRPRGPRRSDGHLLNLFSQLDIDANLIFPTNKHFVAPGEPVILGRPRSPWLSMRPSVLLWNERAQRPHAKFRCDILLTGAARRQNPELWWSIRG